MKRRASGMWQRGARDIERRMSRWGRRARGFRSGRCLRLEPLELRMLLSVDVADAIVDPFNLEGILPGLPLDTSSYDASSVVVRVQSGTDIDALLQATLPGSRAVGNVQLVSDLYKIELPSDLDVQAALSALTSLPPVLYVQPNYHLALDQAVYPDDPGFAYLWGLQNTGQWGGVPDADIDAPEAWGVTHGDSSVIVAVIDTGVDYLHPDLAANIWTNPGEIAGDGIDNDGNGFIDDVHGWDFCNDDADPMDDHGHGTHVSGTIAAIGNNGIGVAGIAWNVKIMPIKTFSTGGTGNAFDAIQGLDYAVSMGARVSNNSYQMYGMYDAIAAARQADHIFVSSAGNDGIDTDATPHYPSGYELENIISVAATDQNDNLTSWSNYGATTVDLGAPGANIVSTLPGNDYGTMSGTSMASPHVTGVVALVRSVQPQWSATQVKNAILSTVDPVVSLAGRTLTGGRLNAASAVSLALSSPGAVPMAGGDLDPMANLVAWWELNEGSGLVAADTSPVGANHPATLMDDTMWSPYGLGGSLSFDGHGDMLSVPDSASINTTSVMQRTISLYFAASDVSESAPRQVIYEEGGTTRGINVYLDRGQLYVGGWNTPASESGWEGTFLSAGRVQGGQWHHVAVVLSGGETLQSGAIRAYLDGTLFGSGIASQLWEHGDNTGIGQVAEWSRYHTGEVSDAGYGYAGLIDEVRIYNRVLGDDEISTLAQQPLVLPDTLAIQLASASVTEGSDAVQGTLTRGGDLTDPLTVTLVSSDPTEAMVPETVTILAGESQGTFSVTVQDDALSDGTQQITISGSAPGYWDAAAMLEVVDDEPNTQNLVACWDFDEAEGVVAVDSSPYGINNSGTLVGGTARVDQGLNRSLQFDGSDDKVAITDSSDINIRVVTQRTISLWFSADDASLSSRKQILFEEGGTSRGLNVYLFAGRLYVGGWNSPAGESGWEGTFLSTDQVQSGQWHHVALVLNGGPTVRESAFKAYLDGVEFGSGAGSQLWSHGDDTGIGQVSEWSKYHTGEASLASNGFAGLIDEVNVYNRALEAHEIEQLAAQVMVTRDQLSVSIAVDSISEQGGSAQAEVTRSGDLSNPLVVNLTVSDPTRTTAPTSVTIPADENSTTFVITAVNDNVWDGNDSIVLTASATDMTSGSDSLQVLDDELVLVHGVVTGVSNTWQTVTLPQGYTSMVIVATPSYTESHVPVVTRVRNAAGNSFQLRVDRTDGVAQEVTGVTVHYVAADEGVYTLERDGVKLEAVKYLSTVTDGQGHWIGESRAMRRRTRVPSYWDKFSRITIRTSQFSGPAVTRLLIQLGTTCCTWENMSVKTRTTHVLTRRLDILCWSLRGDGRWQPIHGWSGLADDSRNGQCAAVHLLSQWLGVSSAWRWPVWQVCTETKGDGLYSMAPTQSPRRTCSWRRTRIRRATPIGCM